MDFVSWYIIIKSFLYVYINKFTFLYPYNSIIIGITRLFFGYQVSLEKPASTSFCLMLRDKTGQYDDNTCSAFLSEIVLFSGRTKQRIHSFVVCEKLTRENACSNIFRSFAHSDADVLG